MMRRTLLVRVSVLALVIVLDGVSGRAWAQSTATLQGAVVDTQGAVMPGVSVSIRNVATGLDRTTISDNAGQYVAASLQPGHYLVTAHIEGFQDQKAEVDLGPAQTSVVNFKLGLAALQEALTVTGQSPIIETATVSVG